MKNEDLSIKHVALSTFNQAIVDLGVSESAAKMDGFRGNEVLDSDKT